MKKMPLFEQPAHFHAATGRAGISNRAAFTISTPHAPLSEMTGGCGSRADHHGPAWNVVEGALAACDSAGASGKVHGGRGNEIRRDWAPQPIAAQSPELDA